MAAPGRSRGRGILTTIAVATVVVLALGTASLATTVHTAHETNSRAAVTSKRAFHDGMRKLWIDHVTWTRLFIVSFVADVPDLQATTERLLQNQTDIGDAVKPFYGRAAGNALTDLLEGHILTAADLLGAAKAGDSDAFEAAKAAWYENGRQIAGFLHDANPENWRLRDLKMMMREHLDITLAEAAAQLGGDYAASIEAFDAAEVEIIHMADMLSAGIMKQFPKKFA